MSQSISMRVEEQTPRKTRPLLRSESRETEDETERGGKTYLDVSVLKCFPTLEKSRPLIEKMQEKPTQQLSACSL